MATAFPPALQAGQDWVIVQLEFANRFPFVAQAIREKTDAHVLQLKLPIKRSFGELPIELVHQALEGADGTFQLPRRESGAFPRCS